MLEIDAANNGTRRADHVQRTTVGDDYVWAADLCNRWPRQLGRPWRLDWYTGWTKLVFVYAA